MNRSVASGQLAFALTLIVIGIVFLLRNYLALDIGSWWALFILIPAAAMLARAWERWRDRDDSESVSGPLVSGLLLLTVTAIFLFDLEWGRIWPVFLILIGLGAVVPRLIPRRA